MTRRRISREALEASRARRAELVLLSKQISALVGLGAYDSINEGLKDMYARQGHTDLRTFKEWKADGFSVNQGEKSCMIWSKPIARKASEKKSDPDVGVVLGADDEDDTTKMFAVCHLYGRDQVHARA